MTSLGRKAFKFRLSGSAPQIQRPNRSPSQPQNSKPQIDPSDGRISLELCETSAIQALLPCSPRLPSCTSTGGCGRRSFRDVRSARMCVSEPRQLMKQVFAQVFMNSVLQACVPESKHLTKPHIQEHEASEAVQKTD